MRHQLRFLSILLLSLVVGIASAQTLIQKSSSNDYDGLSYSFDTDGYLTLNNGTRLLLSGAATGNYGYYFAGADVKTTGNATHQVYVVETVGTYDYTDTNSAVKRVQTFRLKRESDNNYVKAPSTSSIEMTTSADEAAVFFAYNPDGVNGAAPSGLNAALSTDNVIRLQATSKTIYLNVGSYNTSVSWATGTGALSVWALYIAPAKEDTGGDTGDTDETTAEELQAAIDKANELFSTALITDASQFNSNSKEPTEGSYEALIDSDASTYFHSNWSSYGSSEQPHDLQITFANNDELAYFKVVYTARANNSYGRPTAITVYGGTNTDGTVTWDTSSFASLTAESEGLGGDEGSFYITADKNSYNALRFDVTAAYNWDYLNYFSYGEFQVYGIDYTELAGYTADEDLVTALAEATQAAQDAIKAGSGYGDAYTALTAAYDAIYPTIEAQIAAKDLQTLIDECEEELAEVEENAGIPGYPTEENISTLSEAITEAQALVDAAASTVEEYNAAKTSLEATAETALQNAISFPTDSYFTITNERGALVYDDSKALSNNNEIFIWYGTAEANNPNHLWGFYKDESTGSYYLYNVGAKLFAASNGTGSYGNTWVLVSEASPIALSLTWRDSANTIGNHKVSIKGGDDYMSISPNYAGPVITYYGDNDGGVPFLFAKSDYTFDQDLYDNFATSADRQADLAALIAEAKQTLNTVNYKKLITDASQFNSNNKDPEEGSYAALLDGDASTFFHSNWHDQGTEYHDLQVTFEDVATYEFMVKYETRSGENDAWATRPTEINIYGGQQQSDGSVIWNTTPFTTKSFSQTGVKSGSYTLQTDQLYNALRFEVTNTLRNQNQGDGSLYFSYGEFQLYAVGVTDVKQTYITALKDAIEAAENASFADICSEEKFRDIYIALWDANYDVLRDYDAINLRAAVADARTKCEEAAAQQGVPGYLDDEAAAAFNAAIDNADEVANDITTERDDISAASTALSTAVDKYYGHSWVSYPETSYFVITNARGSIVYDAEHASSLDTKLGKEFIWYATDADETDPNNLWGFLENAATGDHYLYNVGQELFANCDGQGGYEEGTTWVLSETPSPITMSGLDFPTLRIMSGDNTMSVSPYYTGPIISYYADGDGGVPFSFAKSSVEFDESLYQAMADRAGVVTGVNSFSTTSSLRVSGGHGSLTMTSSAPATVSVTALSGVVVARAALAAGSTTTIALPAGIYVVAGQKVVVK